MIHDTELSPRQRRKRARRREEILEEALALVGASGLEGLTIHRLAKRLDYTPGALYRYFASKGALIAQVQGHVMQAILEDLEAALAERTWPAALSPAQAALAAVIALGQRFTAMLDERPQHLNLIAVITADPRRIIPDDEVAELVPTYEALLGFVDSHLDAAAAAGSLEPATGVDRRARALMLWSTLQGLHHLEKLQRVPAFGVDPRVLAPQLVGSLLMGWGAARADVEVARRAAEEAVAG